ncbi:MAG: acetylxylan esterase [Lunatimonas sp.]|uniref:alpha/beta hydrolase family protein n=1 Tax=Lunatimonas sp. TaxID=2060141 RepID=UPI00263A77C1|nr:acetylxylan esterase [Lunatimonas sp.]MCC5936485.1 acetylxylan esterase [Lunatimonas sp.]
MKSLLHLLLFFLIPGLLIAQEDLAVIQPHWVNFKDGPNALYKHLTAQAFSHLEIRDAEIAAIQSLDQWKERQAWTQKTLLEVVGPFPEKTPLNPQITRRIEKEKFLLEHVVFESQPGFYVTSTLFIPKGIRGKAPVVIFCSGHAQEAYRSATYQHMILNLVYKGFIVFAFDPVGQGERLEYFDPATNESTIGGPTKQHSYPGAQAFIAGTSQATYMIWDGIRAVDYLLTRKEVDPARIGITGRSGGGTQSAYIAAFDERIYASAPENYITNFKRLWLTHGPQDAEQNFYRGIQQGLDQPDLLIVRAPKPSQMITTTRDIFNIEGAREAATQARKVYESYGAEGLFEMVEDDAAHASTPKNREAMYAFFQRHLQLPGHSMDEPVDTLSKADLQVTPTGQVLTSFEGKRVFDLNQRMLASLPELPRDLVSTAKDLSGYVEPIAPAESMMVGRFQREGYSVEKYLMKGEGDYWIPYLLMKPNQGTTKAVLYLDPSGKATDAAVQGDMEALVRGGAMVLAPDLLNVGEMGQGGFTGDSNFEGHSYNLWFGSILIGRSITGIHAGDANRLVKILQDKEGVTEIRGLAKGAMSSVLLHAAAFNPSISGIALVNPLTSFQELVRDPQYDPSMTAYTVPYSGKAYDLPQLINYLSDRKPLILSSEVPVGEGVKIEELPSPAKNAAQQVVTRSARERQEYLGQWLKP